MINFPIILWTATLCAGICFSEQKPKVESARFPDEIRFRKVPGAETGGAVLGLGKQGGFDDNWVTCPTVIWEGNHYKMWYSSYYDSKMGRGGIGLSTSKDGISWQRQNNGEPVLKVSKNEFDNGQIMGPAVLPNSKGYAMWYTGMAKNWHKSGFGFYRIGLATSRDGVKWKRANGGRPVVDTGDITSFDNVQAATPSIIKEDSEYKMWYAAWSDDSKKNHRICLASSLDGINWSKENGGNPVMGLTPEFAYAPAVVRSGGNYLMFYMALKASGLFAATSKDGLHWAMLNGGQPVIAPGTGDDFDSLLVGHAFPLVIDGRIMLWYTGYKKTENGMSLSIGLAVQDL